MASQMSWLEMRAMVFLVLIWNIQYKFMHRGNREIFRRFCTLLQILISFSKFLPNLTNSWFFFLQILEKCYALLKNLTKSYTLLQIIMISYNLWQSITIYKNSFQYFANSLKFLQISTNSYKSYKKIFLTILKSFQKYNIHTTAYNFWQFLTHYYKYYKNSL